MKRFATPLEAEAAFYAAFSRRDPAAMMAVWDEGDDIACVHPMGTILVGREAVRASWEAILRNSPDMTFVVQERSRIEQGDLAIHVVEEHIRPAGERARAPMLATNAYRLTAGGWRMILHHSSPPARAGGEAPAPAAPTFH